MLPVVLVLHHRLHCREPLLEQPAQACLFARAIGIAAPDEISLGEIGTIGPARLVDQRLQPGAIGAWLRAENPERCPPVRLCIVRRFRSAGHFRPVPARRADCRLVLVQRRHRAHCLVEQRDLVRKGVAEKPEIRSVTSTRGRFSIANRNDLEAGDPPRSPASQTGFAPISASAWAMSSPPVRMFDVPQAVSAIDAAIRHGPGHAAIRSSADFPQFPGGRRRHRAAVDRVEVAPRGQHVRPPARRRAGRPGLDEPPIKRRHQPVDFRLAAGLDRGPDASSISSITAVVPAQACGTGLRPDQLRRQQLDPFDRIAIAAPGIVGNGPQCVRLAPRSTGRPSRSRADRNRVPRSAAIARCEASSPGLVARA
jgi:hypothetical protein